MVKGIVTAVIVIALVLLIVGGTMNLGGLIPKPEQYAAATATIIASQAQATRYAAETQATRTYLEARQTAVPVQVGNEIQTEGARNFGSVAALIGLLIILVMCGVAFSMILQRRAHTVPRDATGQLPAFIQGETVTNLQSSVGPVTVPQIDTLWKIYRVLHYLETGKVLEQPSTMPQLANGVDADHLLAATQSANAATALAALARPGSNPRDVKARLEITKGGAIPQLTAPSAPVTRVTFQGPVHAIAARLGDLLPTEDQPKLIGNDGSDLTSETR